MSTELLEQQLISLRHELHRHPELSGQEFQTTERLKSELYKHDIQVSDWGLKTGLIADIGSGFPIVAIRADIDALPIHEQIQQDFSSTHAGVMHACGHDLHSSSILGAAILLKANESALKGTVRVIFQPAEETYSGAYEVINSGALDGVSAIFGFHNVPELPLGTLATRAGAFYANVDRFKILIKGKGGHAGRPHETKDPIVVAAQLVSAVQSITSRSINNLETCVVSVTQVHAGTSWNIVPETAQLEGTVRTHAQAVRLEVEQRLKQIAAGLAAAYSVDIFVDWDNGPSALINTARWVDFSQKIAEAQGYEVQQAPLYLIGEDFGAYLEHIPGAFVSIGSASTYGLHHPQYQPNESLIFPAAQYFAALAKNALESIHQHKEVAHES